MAEPIPPKPICVIRIPKSSLGGSQDISPALRAIQDHFDRSKPDYHWFVLPIDDAAEPEREVEFQVFYEKDRQPISAEELKDLIQKSLAHAG